MAGIEPPPRIIGEFTSIWKSWLNNLFNFIKLHTGGSSPTSPTTGSNWNAHGNTAVGGGSYSLDNDLSIPTGNSYQINSVDIVSRDSLGQLNIGVGNTLWDAGSEAFINFSAGASNLVEASRNGVGVGINNSIIDGRRGIAIGYNNSTSWHDNIAIGSSCVVTSSSGPSIAMGYNSTADYSEGVSIGYNCTSEGPSLAIGNRCTSSDPVTNLNSMALGINCTATGPNCVAFGIGVTNTVGQSFKIGPNDLSACVIAGNGFGVAESNPKARIHIGPGNITVPSIIFETSPALITTPTAGAIEYAPIGGGTDNYIYFTHVNNTRSLISTNHAVTKTAGTHTIAVEESAIICNCTAGNVTVNLPNPAHCVDRVINIKGFTTSGSKVFIINAAAVGGSTIERQTSISTTIGTSYTSWHSYQIISDGTEWWII